MLGLLRDAHGFLATVGHGAGRTFGPQQQLPRRSAGRVRGANQHPGDQPRGETKSLHVIPPYRAEQYPIYMIIPKGDGAPSYELSASAPPMRGWIPGPYARNRVHSGRRSTQWRLTWPARIP